MQLRDPETGRLHPGLGDPRGLAVAPDGKTVYVANPDSNSVSVIGVASGGARIAAKVVVLSSADGSTVGSINLGDAPNAADGYAPTGIALTATPTAGS